MKNDEWVEACFTANGIDIYYAREKLSWHIGFRDSALAAAFARAKYLANRGVKNDNS